MRVCERERVRYVGPEVSLIVAKVDEEVVKGVVEAGQELSNYCHKK